MQQPKSKLHAILIQREMTQEELRRKIQDTTGYNLGSDRISRIVNGQLTNYYLHTAALIARTLNVSIDDITEDEVYQHG